MNAFEIIVQHRAEFELGLWVTAKLCFVIWPTGIILGTLLGSAAARWKLAVGIPMRAASFILSSIPVLVFLFWMHYPAQSLLGLVVDPFYTAAATLAIVNTFMVSDLVRSALNDFPKHFVVVARGCGLTPRQTFLRIQLPIMLRQVLPSLLVIQVVMLQATLFASLISVDEIFRVAQRVNSQVYRPVEIYTALAVFYLLACAPLHALAAWLKVRFTRDLSER